MGDSLSRAERGISGASAPPPPRPLLVANGFAVLPEILRRFAAQDKFGRWATVYPERSEGSPVHQRRRRLVLCSWRTVSLCYRRSFAASRLRINLGDGREHRGGVLACVCDLWGSVYPERSEGSPVHQRRRRLVLCSWRTVSLCYRRSFAASRLRINLGDGREHRGGELAC